MKQLIVPIILIGLGLWVLTSAAMFFWHARKGPQLRRAITKFERVFPDASTQILLAGDSVMYGVGASGSNHSIAGLFGRDFPQAGITNVGVSGAETDGLIQQLQAVQKQHFTLVVIIIGANDVVHFSNLNQSAKNLHQALMMAKTRADYVVLMPEGNMGNPPLFPSLASLVFTRRSRQFRQAAMKLTAQSGAVYADVFHERKNDPWRARPKYYYAADLFHPADPGHEDWYQAIRRGMTAAGIELK